MKILIITNCYPSPVAPNTFSFNRQQFIRLAEAGNEVDIIHLIPWTTAFRHFRKLFRTEKISEFIRYCVFFYTPKIGYRFYPFYMFLSLLLQYRYIKQLNPDCFFVSWGYPDSVAVSLLNRIFKKPMFVKVHGSDVNVHGLYPERARQFVKSMNNSNGIVSVSQDLKSKLSKLGVEESKVHVIYNGVDHELFYEDDKNKCRTELNLEHSLQYLLFIGNLKKEKGCVDLLNAFVELRKKIDSVELVYIGTGKAGKEIESLARQNDLLNYVHLMGSLEHKALKNWINASDVVVLPSYNEGVPNVLLEAMACGTPVVATNVGGIPEIVPKKSGIIVEKQNVEELAEGLKQALNNSWNRSAISEGVKDITWHNNINQLIKVLDQKAG